MGARRRCGRALVLAGAAAAAALALAQQLLARVAAPRAPAPHALRGNASASRARPNIVWVMADDMGWGEVGLFPATSPHGRIATPHLDRFGSEGTVFRQAYAGYTVCAPSRTTLFTGRHSGHFRSAGLDGTRLPPSKGVGTLAEVLRAAGYATGAFGKSAPLTSPLDLGFEAFVGQVDQALCHNMYPSKIDIGHGQLNFDLLGNRGKRSRELCMAHPGQYNYTTDVFHDSAMSWLEDVAGGPRPFFLYLSFTVPHAGGWEDAPYTTEDGAPVPTDLQYEHKAWPDVEKDHAAAITYMDGKVGDLMRRLDRLGVDNSTLVIFASDNGAHLEGGGHRPEFFNSTGGLRGHKRSLYEGGVRSPTMARWPGVVPAGRWSDFVWAFWDVLPTLAELSGAPCPPGLDGRSIAPTLLGEAQAPHEYLFWTWPGWPPAGGLGGAHTPSGYAVRQGRWKGIVRHCRGLTPSAADSASMLLYDLHVDPFEALDIAGQHRGKVLELVHLVMSNNVSCQCYQC